MKSWSGGEDERKCGFNPVKFLSVCLVLSLSFWVLVVFTDPPSDGLWAVIQARNLYFKLQNAMSRENDGVEVNKLLGGLLPTGFDQESCLSRYQLPLYWRGVARKPSPGLIAKLRSYEARHKRCGPHTAAFNQTLVLVNSDNSTAIMDCKYVVWVDTDGLGNKMLSLASTFLYALLTDRVLLADRGGGIPDLFCEPFPEASIFLPTDFPFTNRFTTFNQQSDETYGHHLRTNSSPSAPTYMYLYLSNECDEHDKLFFCDQQQAYLHSIPWLILRTNQYIAPSFFLTPSFQQELDTLFPEKETVFHLLGRYLFRPTNSVWGLVTRFHEAYLSRADVKVGIQIRLYDHATAFTDEQILSCTRRENILPQISQHPTNITTITTTRVSVVMVSLKSGYFERIRDMYWENATERGEVVGFFQPSHEEYQQTGKPNHDRKALAEIYVLSLTDEDKLVTSGWSTFGYVAQAFAGVKPWILYRSQDQTVPDPPCGRGVSLEPCYHTPPHFDCQTGRGGVDLSGVVPHVRQCEDYSTGLKLF